MRRRPTLRRPTATPPTPWITLIIAVVTLIAATTLAVFSDDSDVDLLARTLVALGAAAAAAAIPGAMSLNISPARSTTLSASGAIVVFFVVYLADPGSLGRNDQEPTPTIAVINRPESGGFGEASPAASPVASPVASPESSPVASPVR